MNPESQTPIILSLGSINADLQFDVADRLETGGTLRADDFARRAGGKAANVAFFTHRLGAPTKLLGRVGDDSFASIALEPLIEAGLDLDNVTVAPDTLTGVAAIAVPPDGNKSILSASNANDAWSDEAVARVIQAIERSPPRSLLVADFEVSHSVLDAAFEAAGKRGVRTVVDPTFADRISKAELSRFCAAAPNQKEAAELLGMQVRDRMEAERAALELNSLGVEIACVKLSAGGCILGHEHRATLLRAPDVDVVDKTGAGDAFVGALALALLEGRSAFEAACWAVAASTISVGVKGAQESYPKRSQFNEMAAQVLRLNGVA